MLGEQILPVRLYFVFFFSCLSLSSRHGAKPAAVLVARVLWVAVALAIAAPGTLLWHRCVSVVERMPA